VETTEALDCNLIEFLQAFQKLFQKDGDSASVALKDLLHTVILCYMLKYVNKVTHIETVNSFALLIINT